jgi:hypothetical protein
VLEVAGLTDISSSGNRLCRARHLVFVPEAQSGLVVSVFGISPSAVRDPRHIHFPENQHPAFPAIYFRLGAEC